MKIVEGNLVLLGNASIRNQTTTYSVIEIGNQVLQKIRTPTSLDNFLSRAITQQGTTRLFLSGKVLCGVGTPDGKLYGYKAKPFAAILHCIVGVILIPFFGLGLLFLWNGIAELKNFSVACKLKKMGALAISL